MKLLFVVNPISGGIDKEPFLKEAIHFCEYYNIEYHVFKTTGKNDELELKKVLEDFKPDKVASAGGDGSTLFTGVALLNTGIPMGIIPLGSANGMAIELNVNTDPMLALKDLVISEYIKDLDLILVNDEHYCLHIGDIGINAQIVDKYSKDSQRGMKTYAKYFAEEVFKKNYIKYELTADGIKYEGNTLMIAICNARKFGTGVPLNSDGSPFDGEFELVILDKIDSIGLLQAGLSAFDEKYFNKDNRKVIKCKEATIRFPEKNLLQLDGEIIGELDEIRLKILKGAIQFISHKADTFSKSKRL